MTDAPIALVTGAAKGLGLEIARGLAERGQRVYLTARAFAGERVLVNACCPGWLRTDMGGPGATLSAAQGADTPLWLATLPDDGPTGGFFSERAPYPW